MSKITEAFRISALRRGIVVRPKADSITAKQVTLAAFVEMANLGFLVTPDALEGMDEAALTSMLSAARKVMGADRNMIPIYAGFPKQVEELDTITLLVEQILHYWTAGAFLPNYPTIAREGLDVADMLRSVREVKVLTFADAAKNFTYELTTSAVALSEDERILLHNSLEMRHPYLSEAAKIVKEARNGENIQVFVKAVYDVCSYTATELLLALVPVCDNSDQLLRVILTLASTSADSKWDSNYILAVNNLANRHARSIRMNRLSRSVRRLIVEQLGVLSSGFKADSLVGRQDLWRTVMRAVHPYDFTLDDNCKRAADIVHSNVDYRTFNSLVEEGMENGDVSTVVDLLANHQPGNLLRRVVAILRLVKEDVEAIHLAEAVRVAGAKSSLITLISAYNGVISANNEHTRVTRVAGLTNTMLERKEVAKVSTRHLAWVAADLQAAITSVLASRDAPGTAVGIVSSTAVPLVRRDASTSDRVLDRGQELTPVGDGDILRIFGHWNNNQSDSGYMDIGVVVLDEDFQTTAVSTWDAWMNARDWSTYSGDCLVAPGKSAAEFIDVNLKNLRLKYPNAKWAAMTVQSWSGWPMANVDFIAGAMLRSDGKKGEVFDPRTVATAFKPTTDSTQAVPFVVNLETGKMLWIDSSNGSTASGLSSTDDSSVGSIVYDEIARPRLTMGQLATLWAEAHGMPTVDEVVDRDQLLALLS